MYVDIKKIDNGVIVHIANSGLGKIVRPGEFFHGVRYTRLRKMGDGRHWLKERRPKRRADQRPTSD
jgi:hypothetical protein